MATDYVTERVVYKRRWSARKIKAKNIYMYRPLTTEF